MRRGWRRALVALALALGLVHAGAQPALAQANATLGDIPAGKTLTVSFDTTVVAVPTAAFASNQGASRVRSRSAPTNRFRNAPFLLQSSYSWKRALSRSTKSTKSGEKTCFVWRHHEAPPGEQARRARVIRTPRYASESRAPCAC